jgi:hypothetical protein
MKYRIHHLLITAITLILLTSCSNHPYFVIENKSEKEITFEIAYDSLDIAKIVAGDIFTKRNPKYLFY